MELPDDVEELKRLISSLKQQMQAAGIQPAGREIPLDEAEAKLKAALQRLMQGDADLEVQNEFERWDRLVSSHPDHIRKLQEQDEAWDREESAENQKALQELRKTVPVGVASMTTEEILRVCGDDALAKRIKKKRALWFVHIDTESIKKMHIVDLQSSYSCHGLTMEELRGVYAVLSTFTFSEPKKEEWRRDVRSKLKELTQRRKRALSETAKKKQSEGAPRNRRHTIGATADKKQRCSTSMQSKQAALKAGLMGSFKTRAKDSSCDARVSFKMSLQSALNAKLGTKDAPEGKMVEERKRGDGKDAIRAKLSLMLGGGGRGGRGGPGRGRGGLGTCRGRGGRRTHAKKKNDGKDDIRAKLTLMLGGGRGRGQGRVRGSGRGLGGHAGSTSRQPKSADPEKEAFKAKLNSLLRGGAPRGVIRKTGKLRTAVLGVKPDPAKKAKICAELEGMFGKRNERRSLQEKPAAESEQKTFSPRPPPFAVRRRASLSPHLLAKFEGRRGRGSSAPTMTTPRKDVEPLEEKTKCNEKTSTTNVDDTEKKTPGSGSRESLAMSGVDALSPKEQELILTLRKQASVQADATPEVLSPAEHAFVLKLRSEGALVDVEHVNDLVRRVAFGAKIKEGQATTEVLSPSEKSILFKLREEGTLAKGVSNIEQIVDRVVLEANNDTLEAPRNKTAVSSGAKGHNSCSSSSSSISGSSGSSGTRPSSVSKGHKEEEQHSSLSKFTGAATLVAFMLGVIAFIVLKSMYQTGHTQNPVPKITRVRNATSAIGRHRGKTWNTRSRQYRRKRARGRDLSVQVSPNFRWFSSMQDAFVVSFRFGDPFVDKYHLCFVVGEDLKKKHVKLHKPQCFKLLSPQRFSHLSKGGVAGSGAETTPATYRQYPRCPTAVVSPQRLPTYFAIDRAGLQGGGSVSWLRHASGDGGECKEARKLHRLDLMHMQSTIACTRSLSLAPAKPPLDKSGNFDMDNNRCLDVIVNLVHNRGLSNQSSVKVSTMTHCARYPTARLLVDSEYHEGDDDDDDDENHVGHEGDAKVEDESKNGGVEWYKRYSSWRNKKNTKAE